MKHRTHRAGPARLVARPAASWPAVLAQALEHHQAGQFDAATAGYREVLRAVPEHPDALHLLGVVALQPQRLADAETDIRAALALAPEQPTFWNSLGNVGMATGNLGEAATSYQRAVTLSRDYVEAWANLATARAALADSEGEALALERVTALAAGHAPAWHRRAVLAYQAGRLADTAALLERLLVLEPANVEAWSNLGAVQISLGQLGPAETSLRWALALNDAFPAALTNLGNVLVLQSRWAEALDVLSRAVALAPEAANGWASLGHALKGLERHAEAVAAYERALALAPGMAGAAVGLGDAFQGLGEIERALSWYDRALMLGMNDADTFDHYGVALERLGRLDEAVGYYERALARQPDAVEICNRHASALQKLGRLWDAVAAYRRSLVLAPDQATIHTTLIFILDLLEGAEAAARDERHRWNLRFGSPILSSQLPFLNDRTPGRRLRVGYVSADFQQHSSSFAVLPILESHDHERVTVVCYSGVTEPDALTPRFRAAADLWRDVAAHSDEALAALIRADQIDLLVDLSGHTNGNRLTVFGRRPAPVQITAWGYATGTGMDAMDYVLGDPVAVPPEARQDYAEEGIDLPSVWCYAPPRPIPPVTLPPLVERGHVTFGAFNRLLKISSGVVAAWARVLHAVPHSRLIIKTSRQGVDPARDRLLDELVALGIDRERVELRGNTAQFEHVAAHSDVDLMLDSFPHGGGATTLDAFLMGVPVVTLLGQRVPGRLAASFLTTLDMPDLIAQTVDEYVDIAVRMAVDPDRLMRERATLRDRLFASPIGDPQLYTRSVEDVYQELWQRWCTANPTRARVHVPVSAATVRRVA